MKDQSVYDVITSRIIDIIEREQVLPWCRPWASGNHAPRNLISKNPYKGVNVLLLSSLHFESPYFVTYAQAKTLKGHVKKGERGCPVIFWRFIDVEDKNTGEEKKIPLARYYVVFNAQAQCEGLIVPPVSVPVREFSPVEEAERIFKAMPHPPALHHGSSQAYYSPAQDLVAMPNPEQFKSAEDYYSVLFHELTHATGHESRLNRKGVALSKGLSPFGSTDYSFEELTAEQGACFLCAEARIANNVQNSASYIKGWLERLRNDSKLIVQSSAAAQKAADFILNRNQAQVTEHQEG